MKCFNIINNICFVIVLTVGLVFAKTDGLTLPTPDANISLGIGFNYDYLKSPFDVDFENAKGYYSINIPIKFALSTEMIDLIFSSMSDNFTDDEYFTPSIAAKQFANTTIKVDVPMLGGVCSFSHINVMSLKYENSTGIPSFRYKPDLNNSNGFDTDLLLLGNLNTPINFSLGWESMMFGYVYKINELFTLGLNMHRHRFYFNADANIDMDIKGNIKTTMSKANMDIPIEYSLKNPLSGEYVLERWTPTFAFRVWRFDLFARIMFKDEAKGALSGKYELPFFVNPSNFTLDDLGNTEYLIENIKNGNFTENKTETVNLATNRNMKWEMPSVLTIKYNFIPENSKRNIDISLSYSKFFGSTKIELVDSTLGRRPDGTTLDYLPHGLDLRMGVNIDHLILANAKFGWFYGGLGIMSLNSDFAGNKNLLSNIDAAYLIPFGKGVMLPTLTGGGIIGTKLQLLLELNVLPLTAFKTGIVYHF